MKRIDQLILIFTFLAFSWLAMQAVHEFGHVVGAWLTRAEVTRVALHPCIISRTDLGSNPHPAVVAGTGPIIGSLLPLVILLVARICRAPGVYLFRFFAAFCLVANGVYMVLGPSDGGVDTGVMIEHGLPRGFLISLGVPAVCLGLYLWHRQGKYFGLGETRGDVSRQAVIVSVLLLAAITTVELIINSR